MNFIAIKTPSTGVAAAGEAPELVDAAFGIVAAREILQVVANQLIETLAQGSCLFAGLGDHLLVDGQSEIHRHSICAHIIRVNCNHLT